MLNGLNTVSRERFCLREREAVRRKRGTEEGEEEEDDNDNKEEKRDG